MALTSEVKGDFTIIRTNYSKLNYENANMYSKQVVDLIEKLLPKNLALDFKGIMYISSIGISALSVIKGITKINHVNLLLFNLAPDVIETLKMSGMDTMFSIVDDESKLSEHVNKKP